MESRMIGSKIAEGRKKIKISPAEPAVITTIQSGLQAICEDAGLREEANFINRAEALDFLDFHIIEQVEGLLQKAGDLESLIALQQQAKEMKLVLDQTDQSLFRHLREKLSEGNCTPSAFKTLIGPYLGDMASGGNSIGYDHLDTFLNELLSDQLLPEETLKREAGMVFYQKTPARIIWELAERVAFSQDDLFFDLGSGLGQVAILVHLLTGVAARGVEYEPAYWYYAQQCASGLNLPGVQFLNQDARSCDYSQATVFFMYTPFDGHMMEEMLTKLRKEAAKRDIRIFTYGPCTFHVAQQEWLHCEERITSDPYKLYEFSTRNKR